VSDAEIPPGVDPTEYGDSMAFCVNCRHHEVGYDGYDAWSLCVRPLSRARDPVTGELNDLVNRSCSRERRKDWSWFGGHRCGPDARFFQLAPPSLRPAQAIEARRAETGTGSVADESPVAKPRAQKV
jgi:hypothetical protein